MAIDTRNKRSSAIGVSLPWRGMLPLPDGAWDQGDRQQVGLVYRGILAGAIAGGNVAVSCTITGKQRSVTITGKQRSATITGKQRLCTIS